jgi:hypothetical protein
MTFDPCNHLLKIWKSIWTPTPKVDSQSGSPFGNVWIHSLTFSYTSKSMKCDSHASLSAHTFVTLYFGHKRWGYNNHEVTMTNQMKNQNKLNIFFFPINLHYTMNDLLQKNSKHLTKYNFLLVTWMLFFKKQSPFLFTPSMATKALQQPTACFHR